MPLSVVVVVRPERQAVVPAAPGVSIWAALLRAIGGVDPIQATALHDDERPSPVAVSALGGPGERRGGRLTLEPGRRYWLRASSLDDGLLEPLLRGLGPGGRLELDGAQLVVDEVHDRDGHPAAARQSLQALADARPVERTLRLRFDSPTLLRGEHHDHLFPEPRRVFASLAARWAATPGARPLETREAVGPLAERWLAPSRYDLATHVYRAGRVPLVGFVGEMEYRVHADAPAALRQDVATLAAAARFASVGAKVAWGCGQCRTLPTGR